MATQAQALTDRPKLFTTKVMNWIRAHIAVKMTISIVLLLLVVSTVFSLSGYWVSKGLATKLEDQFVLRLTSNIQNVANYLAVLPERPEDITDTKQPGYLKIKTIRGVQEA